MQFEFEFESDFGPVAFWHDDHDDMTFIRGDYYSVMLGMLQVSSTTRNLIPRFKWGSKE